MVHPLVWVCGVATLFLWWTLRADKEPNEITPKTMAAIKADDLKRELDWGTTMRLGAEGRGPKPFVMARLGDGNDDYTVEPTAEYRKRKAEEENLDHEELRVLKFLRGEVAS